MLNNSSLPAAIHLALKEEPSFGSWAAVVVVPCLLCLLTLWGSLGEGEAGWRVAAGRLCPGQVLRDRGGTQSQAASSFLPLFFSLRSNGLNGGKWGYLSATEARAFMNNSVLKKARRAERPCCPPPPSPLESHECAFLLSRNGKNLTASSGKLNRLTWATSAEKLTRESGTAPRQHPEVGFASPCQALSKHSCSLVLVHQLETKPENK